jgi:hypothetical protein
MAQATSGPQPEVFPAASQRALATWSVKHHPPHADVAQAGGRLGTVLAQSNNVNAAGFARWVLNLRSFAFVRRTVEVLRGSKQQVRTVAEVAEA